MKIFYFSGTGNSYYVAKEIHMRTDLVSDLESITDYIDHKSVKLQEDVLIVSPVYYYGVSHIVKEFIEKIELDWDSSLSVLFTAEFPNGIAIDIVQEIVKRKSIELKSAFYIKMPTNFILKSKMLNSDEIERVYKSANRKINRVLKYINSGISIIEKESKIYNMLMKSNYKYYSEWENLYKEFDTHFSVNSSCTLCKKCKKNCPANNIDINKKLEWKGKCYGCLKCINICPQKAIIWREQTAGKKQFVNRLVDLKEF